MKVIIFGATGMVGQGALRECLGDPGVERVLAVVRAPALPPHEKLRELVVRDFQDFSAVEKDLAGFDACFFCLGIASAGMSEPDYTRITHDVTVAAGTILARLDPAMTFIFVSGAGADSSESGRVMWARIKGKAENAVLRMPFRASYVFRPAFIQPLHGITSRTRLYRVLYRVMAPIVPALRAAFPRHVTTTEQIGRAMLNVARRGAPKRVLESADISAAASAPATTPPPAASAPAPGSDR
jgi:uncharacterized protein YbjT (DUF2867 family)